MIKRLQGDFTMKDKIILELNDCLVSITNSINMDSENSPHSKQVVLDKMRICYANVVKILDEK